MKTILLTIAIALAACSAPDRVSWPDACSASLKTSKISCKCKRITFESQDHPTLPKPAYKLVEKCGGQEMPIERLVTGE